MLGGVEIGSIYRTKWEEQNTESIGGAKLELFPTLNSTDGIFLQWRQRVTGKYSDGSYIEFNGVEVNNVLDPVGALPSGHEFYDTAAQRGTNPIIEFSDNPSLSWTRLNEELTWLEVSFTLELLNVANKDVTSGGTVLATVNWGYKMIE